MNYPEFIMNFPALDVPFSEDVVKTRAIQSDRGLVVFFTFEQDFEIPAHAHKAQWGTLIHGEIELTIGGVTKTFKPGESWDIPTGVEHRAVVKAGSLAIDVFEEADRYPVKS